MVSPNRPPSRVDTAGASYSAVPNPDVSSPELNQTSPDPNNPFTDSDNPRSSTYLSPGSGASTPMLGRNSFMPAPSMISRDSTHSSLPGTPDLSGNRSSWGSNLALSGAAAGTEVRRPTASRGQSNLQHSSVGWNNTSNDRLSTSDEGDEQGHIAPAPAPVISTGAGARVMNEKRPAWAHEGGAPKKSRKALWIGVGVAAVLLVGLAVGLGVGLSHNKNKTSASSGNAADANAGSIKTRIVSPSEAHSASSSATSSAAPKPTATSGTTGSLVTLDDGSQVEYNNPFGGTWVWDPANPFNNEAQAQSWSKPLNQNWTWGVDRIHGVNVGGWLVTEPFIVPALYETYATGPNNQTAVDEFTLMQNMGDNMTTAMDEHYSTFITELDFLEMVCNGINWVRLPIGFWAVQTWPGEPYYERESWKFVLKAIGWARKYGIRIQLDLHAVPGSQNGWNHSGHLGMINWMYGNMGLANAQRGLDYIRTLAQFISQPEYAPVVQMFGFINEPNAGVVGQEPVGAFYQQAYTIIREITGIGEGHGAMLSIHDGFIGIKSWYDFLPGADRLALDQHPYMIFGDQPMANNDLAQVAQLPCTMWAAQTNQTSITYGPNSAGEWSAAPNDCGQWVNNVGGGSRYDGTYNGFQNKAVGSCDYWNDWTLWNSSTIADLKQLVLAEMDSFQNFFFWTWHIGNSTGPIKEVNPFWSYQLGLKGGWIPSDPRTAVGTCAELGVNSPVFDGTYPSPAGTGGPGAGDIAPSNSASYPWPPVSFTNVAATNMVSLPQYTQTATPVTMPAPTFTSPGSSETFDAGNGWYNAAANTRSAYSAISGCSYPPEYYAASLPVSAGACGAGLVQPTKRDAMPEPIVILPTAAPRK